MKKEKGLMFHTDVEAQEYFKGKKEKAMVLNVEYPKGSENYKPLAFYKQDITLKEKIAFDEELSKEEKNNTDYFPFTYEEETTDKNTGETKSKTKVSIDNVANYLISKYTFKTTYGSKSEKVYIYDEGIYLLNGREVIKTEIEELLQAKTRTNIVKEIYEKIKRKTPISKEEFNKVEEGFVCLENGIYNIKESRFEKHNPKYYFKSKLPIKYNPKAKCPKVLKFLEEVLYGEDIKLIQEWFGFNLYNRYFKKKAIILFGDKDTGKTITLDLLSSFVGECNKVSLSLQNISFAKSFDLLGLKDKFANIYDDLGDKDINDTGGFKIATGGSYITGEEKFGDRIMFKTFAKLTFATNKIPATKDQDDTAYYSRWMPIRFDNQIKESDQDPFLIKKLTTEKEISGLFNWAMMGFQRLIKNNGFSFNKTDEEIKEIMQRSSHPLAMFSQDCLEKLEGMAVSKKDMYEYYSKWCEKNDISRFSKDKFGKNIQRFVSYLGEVRSGKIRCWSNVKLREVVTGITPF